jgi:hypothetical protein
MHGVASLVIASNVQYPVLRVSNIRERIIIERTTGVVVE